MRTQDEIKKRYETRDDAFGFAGVLLVQYLDFEHAKSLLKEEFLAEPGAAKIWQGTQEANDKQSITERMRDYMSFAWEKAHGERGISANRSVIKFENWIWLLCDDDFDNHLMTLDYEPYGIPKLHAICSQYRFQVE